MWIIINTVKRNQRTYYEVQCTCGYVGYRRKDHVDDNRTVECKNCSAKRTFKNGAYKNSCFKIKGEHLGIGLITKTYFNHIKYGAERRNYCFDITLEYVWNLYVSQNGKCALSGINIDLSVDFTEYGSPDYSKITASLDRIDSSIGYIVGNVQWVHKTINFMKQSLSQTEFIQWCSLVHDNHEPNLVNDQE